MKLKWKKWHFWNKLKNFCDRQQKKAWMEGGNCTSRCPKCKQWEHSGNVISRTDNPDGSTSSWCTNCDYRWLAIFTPAGFITVDEFRVSP